MILVVATTNQPRPSEICRRKMRVIIGKKQWERRNYPSLQRRSTAQNQGGANLTKTQVKYVDIRNKTIYTMINLTNHISSDYRDCQTTLNQVMN